MIQHQSPGKKLKNTNEPFKKIRSSVFSPFVFLEANTKCSCERKIERSPSWAKVIWFYSDYLFPKRNPSIGMNSVLWSTVEDRSWTMGDCGSRWSWACLHWKSFPCLFCSRWEQFSGAYCHGMISSMFNIKKKYIHIDSQSVVCVVPVHIHVAGLYSNALVLLCGLLFF